MKPIPLLTLAILLTGCEVMHRPGVVIKQKTVSAGKYGPVEKMSDWITLNGDFPGLSEIPTQEGPIKIAQVSGTRTKLIVSGTHVLGTETETILGGLRVSEHVTARGDADKKRTDAVASGVSGAIVSSAGAAALGPAVGAIPR